MVAAAPFNTPRVQGNSFSFVMDKAGDICQNRKAVGLTQYNLQSFIFCTLFPYQLS
ncbi:hypothetical protein HanRHA438_Chr03g0137521 [Helianthus annuus]|nr:hypothetical protein HanHA89_Chr03g0116571 [Helianthus annuus]KAJ0937023.1 hypothetical protein HanRHA438_Chr03g0137521 [Helianthus annuus]